MRLECSGPLRTKHTALRRSALTLFRTNVAAALTVSYGYDTAGRLSTVGDGAAQATYGYLANSALVEEITFRQSGTQRMKTTRQYGFNNIGNRGSAKWGGSGGPGPRGGRRRAEQTSDGSDHRTALRKVGCRR
jgi:hypothetical protein